MSRLLEELSKNPLQVALVERDELREQLAKANELVKELERESQENLSIIESIANGLSERPVSLCKGVMHGRNQVLNKFAIEKKIEGVNQFCATLSAWEDVHPIGANYVTSLSAHRDSFNEQLRKEQSND